MIRDLLKWIVPGLVVVLAGSTLTLAMTATDIADDVASQSSAMLQRAGFDWAELSFASRDLILSGTTTDPANITAALDRLALLPGVRSVTSDVTLAPLASPYRLEASVADGAIALAGGVPDDRTRQLLLSRAGLEQGALELHSGLPDRRAWIAAAQFAIDQLRYFDQGKVTLSDLTVDIAGRARSERDFRDLLIVMRAGAPAGARLGQVQITPALIAPYHWSATSDGKRIDITGYVPDPAYADQYRTAATGDLQVATGLALGSGEPAGFAETSQLLIEQLSRLEYGSASITDGQSTLTGAPSTPQIAQAVTEALQPSGSIVTLEPPRIADYWVSATLQAGGALVFDGYAPDTATRDRLQQKPGADTQWLQLGRGAPDRYEAALDYGLAALGRMNEGRFALQGQRLTLSGIARSGADYQALLAMPADAAPQGYQLAPAEILAPPATPYQWSAAKAASGAITLSGVVPQPQAKLALLGAAGPAATDAQDYASGEPRNFLATAQTGIGLLNWLADGQVAYDGSGWTLTGTPASAIDKAALEADFVARRLAAAGWSMAIASPRAPTIQIAQASPSAAPAYLWSAVKLPNGDVTLTGKVPSAAIRGVLADGAGDGLTDQTTIDADAPAGFAQDVRAAVAALAHVSDGLARFDGARWRLDGNLIDAEGGAAIDAVLASAATPAGDWGLTLLPPTPPRAPVATPAVPAEPTTAQPLIEAAEAPTPGDQTPEPAAIDPAYAFSATRSSAGALILSGQVPSEAMLDDLLDIAPADTAAVSIAAGAPPTFAASAQAGLRALLLLQTGSLDFADGSWRLAGTATDAAARDAAEQALAADSDVTWATAVDLPAAPAPTPVAPAPAAPAPAARVDISTCAGPIDDFSGRNAILFQSGAALIATESEAALDELVILLKACPDAVINVEGHTDADGDPQQNLALSVARAEAVVSALIAREVNPARLYAVGYGETVPVADNATAAGKRQNRRIVVTVSDAHY